MPTSHGPDWLCQQLVHIYLPYSLAPQIKSSFGGVYRALKPLANAYARACGYRKVGLKYDDLIMEEREDVQKVRRVFCLLLVYDLVSVWLALWTNGKEGESE